MKECTMRKISGTRNRLAAQIFAGINNLILTPHIAGVTQESNTRVSTMIADLVLDRLS